MCQFIETIKVYNGKVFYLDWHQLRLNNTFSQYFPSSKPWDLKQLIQTIEYGQLGLYKLRIVYDNLEYQISIQPYIRNNVNSLECKEIDFQYDYKYANRSHIDTIVNSLNVDEVIFTKNSHLLDASYANIALYDGKRWWTPATYLLNGTTRQRLLAEAKIYEKDIKLNDIPSYKTISFINAMNDLGERTYSLKDHFS